MHARPQSYARRRIALQPGGSLDTPESVICAGEIRIEPETMRVTVHGRPLALRVQEFDLLVLLARKAGTPVTHRELAEGLWREAPPGYSRHLSVLIARLRAKLAASGCHQLETIRKRGYALAPAQTKTASNREKTPRSATNALMTCRQPREEVLGAREQPGAVRTPSR